MSKKPPPLTLHPGEEATLSDLLTGPWPDAKKMNITQLRQEVELWRVAASWMPPSVKYMLSKVGQTIRVYRRDYRSFMGTLLSCNYDFSELEIGVWEKYYDQDQGRFMWEKKVIKMNSGAIMNMEFLSERFEEAQDEEAALREVLIE